MASELGPGSRLGPFEIVDRLGAGGMGEVWRARDTTLDREVALKFLPPALAADADRLGRFEREAKVLASLNHPNIAGIFGLHDHGGIRFLAMEYVPGEDLAERLERGPMPVEEALDVARRIAEAIEAAHDQGVVHRDLKPANVKLTEDGIVKVLDFGLAKALDPVATTGAPAVDPTMSPTITSLGTVAGVVLGTAAYMSPEQAKGKPVDRRTDIWAFGCMLYEMLVGHRPFRGEGISEVLAAVIMAPVPFEELPASLPARARQLVHRCLERDPRRRLRDMGEARYTLEEILSGAPDDTPVATAASKPRSSRALPLAIGATAVVAILATAAIVRGLAPTPPEPPVRRFAIPAKGPFRSTNQSRLVEASPDGSAVAYAEDGKILVRPLSRMEPIVVSTAADPSCLFWSPDGTFLGYAAGGKLWKTPARGGESTAIADIRIPLSGGTSVAWCPDDKIVLGNGEGGLYRVSAQGGDLEPFVPIEAEKESDLHDARCLPDGSVLFVPHMTGGRPSKIVLYADGKRKDLLQLAPDQDIWFPVYSPAGFLLYHRHPANAGVWAVPFSLERREITGDPFLVAADADVPSVANDGTLVHVTGAGSSLTQMFWADREGKLLGPIGPPQEQWPFPQLSPDGRRVAIAAKENELDDIWIHDVERGTHTRLSVSNVPYSLEAWSPDSKTIVFSEGTGSPLTMKIKNADGSGEAKTISTGYAPAYGPGGKTLVFSDIDPVSFWDIRTVDLAGGATPATILNGAATELWPRISPDGKYFAYVSDEGGTNEIYLKRFPSGEGKWQVSLGGGSWPRWSPKGDRIYYARGDTLMEVDVRLEAEPRLGPPREIFTRKPLGRTLIFGWAPGFDVSADGTRFVVVVPMGDEPRTDGIVVVENWLRDFRK